MPWQTVSLIILTIWLIIISGFFVWMFVHINSLIKVAKGDNLLAVFNKLIKKSSDGDRKLKQMEGEISEFEIQAKSHVQKIGIVRFNPFHETGGDHSFSLAVLNDYNSGFVLTGLHTRERTRLYAKFIDGGVCEHELSKEEDEALDKAKKSKK